MKRFLIAASCVALAGPALAQNQWDHPRNEPKTHAPPPAGGGGNHPAPAVQYRGPQGAPNVSGGGYHPAPNAQFHGWQGTPNAPRTGEHPAPNFAAPNTQFHGWQGAPSGGHTRAPNGAYSPPRNGVNPFYKGSSGAYRPPSPNAPQTEPRYGVTRTPNWSGQPAHQGQYDRQYQRQYRGRYQGQYQGRRFTEHDWRYEHDRHWGWNGRRIRWGGFYFPYGYSYERWAIGQDLPYLFLSEQYWFTDYAALGIGPPPWGYEWIRYGPDLLLVDIYTGEIVDVEYGVFY